MTRWPKLNFSLQTRPSLCGLKDKFWSITITEYVYAVTIWILTTSTFKILGSLYSCCLSFENIMTLVLSAFDTYLSCAETEQHQKLIAKFKNVHNWSWWAIDDRIICIKVGKQHLIRSYRGYWHILRTVGVVIWNPGAHLCCVFYDYVGITGISIHGLPIFRGSTVTEQTTTALHICSQWA